MTNPKSSLCKKEDKKDESGQDILLKRGKCQVMMEWEKSYRHACIDALKPSGSVLEIGFGLGHFAGHIQTYRPQSHTIIEYHPEVAKKARTWAASRPNVTLIEDTWQHALDNLGMFDAIFFDDYPIQSEEGLTQMQKQTTSSQTILKTGQELVQKVEKQLPFLRSMRYSDEDLATFMQQIPLSNPTEAKQAARFFLELASHAQISETQCSHLLQQLIHNQQVTKEEIKTLLSAPPPKESFTFSTTTDHFYQFLKLCLKSHMKVGSRLCCLLSSAQSKFEDNVFFNEIILNPLLDFHEEELALPIPSRCNSLCGNKALLITITKRG